MSERDELADKIEAATPISAGDAESIADAILAAGYSKPRTITTAEELAALTIGTVVLDDSENSCQKFADNLWESLDIFHEEQMDFPATVLWEPK